MLAAVDARAPAGSPDVGPLVVKASAGVAFRATILSAPTTADALAVLDIPSVGLRGGQWGCPVCPTALAQRVVPPPPIPVVAPFLAPLTAPLLPYLGRAGEPLAMPPTELAPGPAGMSTVTPIPAPTPMPAGAAPSGGG